METIKIAFAEDNAFYFAGLENLFGKAPGLKLCGSAKNGVELLAAVRAEVPDVVLMDIQMPVMDGLEATRQLTANYPDVKVIALTMYASEQLIVDMLKAGAYGYISKDTTGDDLLAAIAAVSSGHYYYCHTTTMRLSKQIASSELRLVRDEVQLTEQEKAIVQLICKEYCSKEIAPLVNLSVNTIAT